MIRGTEIPKLQRLIAVLEMAARKNKAPVWASAAKRLSSSTRQRAAVNLNMLSRLSKADTVMLVPGKVLSLGAPDKKFTVAAYAYSKAALVKLHATGCKVLTIDELLKENPKGTKVILVV